MIKIQDRRSCGLHYGTRQDRRAGIKIMKLHCAKEKAKVRGKEKKTLKEKRKEQNETGNEQSNLQDSMQGVNLA